MGSSYYHFFYLKFSYVYYYIDNNEKVINKYFLGGVISMETYMIIPNELATKGFAVYKELGKFYVMENGTCWSEGFWDYNDAINAIRRNLV